MATTAHPTTRNGAVRPVRLALTKWETAQALGVSVDFLDDHIAHELRCVRRGRRRLYPISELQRWLAESAEGAPADGRR